MDREIMDVSMESESTDVSDKTGAGVMVKKIPKKTLYIDFDTANVLIFF